MPKSVAIYLRISQEDMDLQSSNTKEESNSISSQRRLITDFLDETSELRDYPRMEFCDDGYSGTNFSRPDFQRMIESARQGEIACIAVKDLSRFGRDYLEVGDYLEHIFPFLGIRFISVNDQYDSAKYDGKTAGMEITFRNLIYDYYSKDLSVKVRSAIRARQEKGEYITCFPYGYKPSPQNKHKMVIDEPAANIVREIFHEVLSGKTTSEIAASLNSRAIPTPQEYKQVRRKDNTKPQWTHFRIVYMIRNIKYTGIMTNHTFESRFIRDQNQRRVPVDDWIINPDAHEAIIPKDEWDRANEMLRRPKKATKNCSIQKDRVYYCGHCGRKLRKTYGSDQYYSCMSSKYQMGSKCSTIRLKRSEIENVLIEALRAQINFVEQTQQSDKKAAVSPAVEYYREISQIEKEIVALQSRKLDRYEAYRSGKISRGEFITIKDSITGLAEELVGKKEQLQRDHQALMQADWHEQNAEAELFKAEGILADVDAGLREHLYDAIDQIIVTANDQIEIKWNFVDCFAQKAEKAVF